MTNKSKKILAEISSGELLDKISILEIKLDRIKNPESQHEIKKEYKLLKDAQISNMKMSDKVKQLFEEIKKVNIKLWNIEDEIRVYEKNKDFGKKFIDLARAVYSTNDKRSKVKLEINEMFGSNIKSVKQYVDY